MYRKTERYGKYVAAMIFAVAMMLFFNHTDVMAATGQITTGGSNVALREGPGTDYDTLDSLENGETVTINGEVDGWYKVTHGDVNGYVRSDLITVTDASGLDEDDTQTDDGQTTDGAGASDADTGTSAITNVDTSKLNTELTIYAGAGAYTPYAVLDESLLPKGYTQTTATVSGGEIPAAYYEATGLTLVCAYDGTDSCLLLYDTQTQIFTNCICFTTSQGQYIIVENPPADATIPQTYSATYLPMDTIQTYTVYISVAEDSVDNLYYVYAMDETGKERLWDLDVTELYYGFSFHEREGKYSKLELDWIDDIRDLLG